MENAHHHLEGLLRVMRSNMMEKTNVKRECQTTAGNVAKTTFERNGMLWSVAESRIESKPKWNRDGKQMACSWESWACLMK